MNLKIYFDKQRKLEQFVQQNIGMDAEEFVSVPMMDKRVFAFKVEFGEFCNEVGFFKYWKQSHVLQREKVLEELADCIHFLLAIGLHRNYWKFIKEIDYNFWQSKEIETLYHEVMNSPIGSSGQWKNTIEQLFCIGIKLGFNIDEIELWYHIKHQKNIERQINKY
jgi:dimeric dUTPase (all-alpha-NTP-PPase superfamily)